jgi:biotin carboxyl carrier protein
LAAILEHPSFLAGSTLTSFLDDHPEVLAPEVPTEVRDRLLTVAAAALFASGTAWRNVVGAPEVLRVTYRQGTRDVMAVLGHAWTRSGGRFFVVADVGVAGDGPSAGTELDVHAGQALSTAAGVVIVDGVRLERTEHEGDDGFVEHRVEIDGIRSTVYLRHEPSEGAESVAVDSEGWLTVFTVLPLGAGAGHDTTAGAPATPVPGTVSHIAVSVGDKVEAGDVLVVLEAMKMEHTIRADTAGTVAQVHVSVGQSVDAHTVVATLTPDSGSS